MKVTMLLADSAQSVGGKLYVLGGGWSVTAPGIPHAVALHFQVPWDQSDDRHSFKLILLTSDGVPFGEDQGTPVSVEGDFQTGRPAGIKKGVPLDSTLAVNIPPLPLEPDSRYEWRLEVNGEMNDQWRLPFSTAPAQDEQG